MPSPSDPDRCPRVCSRYGWGTTVCNLPRPCHIHEKPTQEPIRDDD